MFYGFYNLPFRLYGLALCQCCNFISILQGIFYKGDNKVCPCFEISLFVGQNFGAQRLDRVREGIRFAYRFSLFYGLAIGAFLLLFGGFVVDLFGLQGAARDTALLQMHVVPISYIALGCAMTVNGSLNALGKPVAAMWISMSRTIAVYAPLAWLLSQFFGLVGIFIAAASANAIAGGIGVLWLGLVYREAVADKPLRTRPA